MSVNPWLRLSRIRELKKTLRVVPYNIARDSSYVYHEDMSQAFADDVTFECTSGEVFIDGFVIFRKQDDGKEVVIFQKSLSVHLMSGDIIKVSFKSVQFAGI